MAKKVNIKRAVRPFSKEARKVKALNIAPKPMRGGFRL